jgi:hypothetical protein
MAIDRRPVKHDLVVTASAKFETRAHPPGRLGDIRDASSLHEIGFIGFA